MVEAQEIYNSTQTVCPEIWLKHYSHSFLGPLLEFISYV